MLYYIHTKGNQMLTKRQEAGRTAKKVGHEKEAKLASYLTEITGRAHKTNGASNTKVDIFSVDGLDKWSQKSPSKEHTQVALYPVESWCSFFGIDRTWYHEFFGKPRSGRSGRKNRSQIDEELNQKALEELNSINWFDAVVTHGIYAGEAGESVNKFVWYNKKNESIEIIRTVEELRQNTIGGKWVFSTSVNRFSPEGEKTATVLWFLDKNGKKLYHLQMKGSGELSQKNSIQFHIYKQ